MFHKYLIINSLVRQSSVHSLRLFLFHINIKLYKCTTPVVLKAVFYIMYIIIIIVLMILNIHFREWETMFHKY